MVVTRAMNVIDAISRSRSKRTPNVYTVALSGMTVASDRATDIVQLTQRHSCH
jgi:hypothetical protein